MITKDKLPFLRDDSKIGDRAPLSAFRFMRTESIRAYQDNLEVFTACT